MAITITANDANDDGSGLDLWAYFASFDTTFTREGYGYFDNSGSFSGNEFATTEQPNLIADATKQSVVFDAGGSGTSLDYDMLTHIVGGDLDAISFGYGLTYTTSFQLSQLDLKISGLGFVNQFGAGNAVSELILTSLLSGLRGKAKRIKTLKQRVRIDFLWRRLEREFQIHAMENQRVKVHRKPQPDSSNLT